MTDTHKHTHTHTHTTHYLCLSRYASLSLSFSVSYTFTNILSLSHTHTQKHTTHNTQTMTYHAIQNMQIHSVKLCFILSLLFKLRTTRCWDSRFFYSGFHYSRVFTFYLFHDPTHTHTLAIYQVHLLEKLNSFLTFSEERKSVKNFSSKK